MKNSVRILFIGDIVGRPGRSAVQAVLPSLKKREKIDYVFANGENLSAGRGMTIEKYQEMINVGIDYFTSGNHIWNNKDFIKYLDDLNIKVLRPENYPAGNPGRGIAEIDKDITLVNLQGRVFMPDDISDPFSSAQNIVNQFKNRIIILDFHAEATSEKVALGYYLDGKLSAVLGTHTHVQTADETILPNGSGYISDIGMTGPKESVLGVEKEIIIEKFLTQLPKSHKVATGKMIFSAVVLEINRRSKKATRIKRVYEQISPN